MFVLKVARPQSPPVLRPPPNPHFVISCSLLYFSLPDDNDDDLSLLRSEACFGFEFISMHYGLSNVIIRDKMFTKVCKRETLLLAHF